ncbi:MAG: relaxase/mobilization nuclease domain-containing protein [Lachnospiraceae bacterium]|nr:relaxase/mobilization nuclease domain-containing protein [Lachnospiraceae bacterium]
MRDLVQYEHDEKTMKPLRDKNGAMHLREGFIMDGINCNPETFDVECEMLNAQYHKNQTFSEIKSHHYIISFDPIDQIENGLTGERAQAIGMEYAQKMFPGHQTLVCAHMDGSNGSGNIHVHIVINSLRKLDVPPQEFAERPCDSRAGYKHHLTKDYLAYQKQFLMNLCEREHLCQIDLLSPAEKKISDREYWSEKRGQKKLDKLNEQIIADGLTPAQTKFQTQKQYLRDAVDDVASTATSFEMFQALLHKKYKIRLSRKRGRYSYLHPERSKYISERSLGTRYTQDFLEAQFLENAKTPKHPDMSMGQSQESDRSEKTTSRNHFSDSKKRMPDHNASSDTAGKKQFTDFDPNFDYSSDPIRILYIRSNLHLVVDLQDCAKAQESRDYARKVKISNLKEMAKTIAYVQEQGYDSRDDLRAAYDELNAKAVETRQSLRMTEAQIKVVNENIHYTGQYLANKSVYGQMLKSRNTKQFRQEHSAEIAAYEEAVKLLKTNYPDGQFPSMKSLKERKEKLLELQKAQQETYKYYKSSMKDFRTVCSNVDSILGQGRTLEPEQKQSQSIS